MMFEYDYMNKHLLEDIEKKKARMQRNTEINRTLVTLLIHHFMIFQLKQLKITKQMKMIFKNFYKILLMEVYKR